MMSTWLKIAVMAAEDPTNWAHMLILCILLFGHFDRKITSAYACYFYAAELWQLLATGYHLIRVEMSSPVS